MPGGRREKRVGVPEFYLKINQFQTTPLTARALIVRPSYTSIYSKFKIARFDHMMTSNDMA